MENQESITRQIMNTALKYDEKKTCIILYFKHMHATSTEMTIDEFRKKDFDRYTQKGEFVESVRATRNRDGKITVRAVINMCENAPW